MSTIKVDTINTRTGSGNITISRPTILTAGDIVTADILDANVTTAKVADNAITLAKMAGGTDGQIITYDASGDPVAVGPGTSGQILTSAGAGAPPTFAAAAPGGDKRNYIIDGDFTQWPTGTTATTPALHAYGPALVGVDENSDGTITYERSTVVPTVDESNHQSAYSLLVKCTGTDSSIAAGQFQRFLVYFMTGSDFADLHEQQFTISFWAKTSAANSGHTYYLSLCNRAPDRSYVKSFAPTSSWVKYSFTLTGDTSGTWANIGLESNWAFRITISGAWGTDEDDGTDGAWAAGFETWASSGTAISNFMDDTGNEFYISQFQIQLGSSTGDFVSLSPATVLNQVDYYVQRYNYEDASNEAVIGTGNCNGVNSMPTIFNYRNKMRVAPTATKSAVATWLGKDQAATVVLNTWTANSIGKNAFHAVAGQAGTNWATGSGGHILRNGTATAFVMIDARH